MSSDEQPPKVVPVSEDGEQPDLVSKSEEADSEGKSKSLAA